MKATTMTTPISPIITLPGGVTLKPGDALLYGPSDIFGYLICLKTWGPVCHIEIYAGDGWSVASRNGIGVGKYSFRREQLAYVLRPKAKVDVDAAMTWFQGVDGEEYDWKGLLCFALAVKQGSLDKMFCSEFATRWYRKACVEVFHPLWDADKVAPDDFLMSPAFYWVWEAKS